MRRAFALLIAMLFPLVVWSDSDYVVRAVTQSVKGTRILRVALRPIPNTSAMQITIFTSQGERSLILSKSHIKTALQTLNNPFLIGRENVRVSQRFINANPNFKEYITFTTAENAGMPSQAAIVHSTMTAANRQASR